MLEREEFVVAEDVLRGDDPRKLRAVPKAKKAA